MHNVLQRNVSRLAIQRDTSAANLGVLQRNLPEQTEPEDRMQPGFRAHRVVVQSDREPAQRKYGGPDIDNRKGTGLRRANSLRFQGKPAAERRAVAPV